MRIAAGVLMILYGIAFIALGLVTSVIMFLQFVVTDVPGSQNHQYLLLISALFLLMAISSVFPVVGGAFCIRRRHWRVCLTAALFQLVIMICWSVPSIMSSWFIIPLAILPIIFVSLRKREWQQSQA
jgi:hypothetical protein